MNKITIREIELGDIDAIVDYWLSSPDDYLIGMGVDLNKRPTKEQITTGLTEQINTPFVNKTSLAMVAVNGKEAIGHCNIIDIRQGKKGNMHLHLWEKEDRRKGFGLQMVQLSTAYFFEKFELQQIICEPSSHNPAPHNVLTSAGFVFEKEYCTTPGPLCIENQLVSRYILQKGLTVSIAT
jgi:RimJ/RimL family protein N-acetyltransferase